MLCSRFRDPVLVYSERMRPGLIKSCFAYRYTGAHCNARTYARPDACTYPGTDTCPHSRSDARTNPGTDARAYTGSHTRARPGSDARAYARSNGCTLQSTGCNQEPD